LKALYRYENGWKHGHGSIYDRQGEVKKQFQFEYGHLKKEPREPKTGDDGEENDDVQDSLKPGKRLFHLFRKTNPEDKNTMEPRGNKSGKTKDPENKTPQKEKESSTEASDPSETKPKTK
jgi:hypothetical protein